ncbi:MAG TPA: hypothetical protein VGP30_08455 [Candidatus Limnocylindrales bacterium]|nr:hypothetical protein [Candidatus Limnocylindrales bacterium]
MFARDWYDGGVDMPLSAGSPGLPTDIAPRLQRRRLELQGATRTYDNGHEIRRKAGMMDVSGLKRLRPARHPMVSCCIGGSRGRLPG